MAKENKLEVESRKKMGSASARRLRKSGALPGIINNEKGEAQPIQLKMHGFEMLLRHQRSENIIFDITVDSEKPKKVLLKQIQHDPITGGLQHVDFIEISMTHKMRVNIPIVLHGDPVGVLQEDGILEHVVRALEVECLPGDLVDVIDADVSALKLGQGLRVKELKIDPKLTVITEPEVVVALVSMPRKEEEEVKPEEAAAAEGAAEPELIGRKKDEDEEAEGAEEGEGKEKKAEKGVEKGAEKKGEKAEKGAEKKEKADKGGDRGMAKKEERKEKKK